MEINIEVNEHNKVYGESGRIYPYIKGDGFMAWHNQYTELDIYDSAAMLKPVRHFEVNRCDKTTVITIPVIRKTGSSCGAKCLYSFIPAKKRFKVLSCNYKRNVKFCIDTVYRKAVLSGEGFEPSDMFQSLYIQNKDALPVAYAENHCMVN